MAFYHWAGPAMRATVEGKQKAREDEQTSRMREIQMQQLLESIAGAQQERGFGAEKMGWEREARPMKQRQAELELQKMLLGNTGLELSNTAQGLKNQFEGDTIQKRIEIENALNELKGKQTGVESGFIDSGLYGKSREEELLRQGLLNDQTKQAIQFARNADRRAAASQNNESLKKMVDGMVMEAARLRAEGELVKAANLSMRINEIRRDMMSPSEAAMIDYRNAQVENLENPAKGGGKGGSRGGGKGGDGSKQDEQLVDEFMKIVAPAEVKKTQSFLRRFGQALPIVNRFVPDAPPDQIEQGLINAGRKVREFRNRLGAGDPRSIAGDLPPELTAPVQNEPRRPSEEQMQAQLLSQAVGRRLSPEEFSEAQRLLTLNVPIAQVVEMLKAGAR